MLNRKKTINDAIPAVKPIKSPVHLAHSGNWYPRKNKLRSFI